MTRLAFVLILLAAPLHAGTLSKKTEDFVAANMIAVLYHEFGHALIDMLKLPIYGQEEDAADVLSAVLIHDFFNEKTAQRIAFATANGFLGEQSITEAERSDVAYWDVHGPDLQRYYTFICLFYGGNPIKRHGFAQKLELPEARRDTCEEEFQQASFAWRPVVDKLKGIGDGRDIRFLADYRVNAAGKLTVDVLEREVRALNRDMNLPGELLVRVEPCDAINAYYVPKTREIIMCTEFADYMADIGDRKLAE